MDDADSCLGLQDRELEKAFRPAPIPLCVLDRQFRYLLVNDRMAELNGRPVAEHLGRTIDELVPTFAEKIKAEVRPVLERGQPERDHLFSGPVPENPTATGDWLASYYPLHGDDGCVRGVIVALVEVTRLRRSERLASPAEPQKASATEADAGRQDRWDGRVLLAADSADTQRGLRNCLESAGLQVDTVGDGLTAVRQAMTASAAGQPYALILLDLQMPKLDGYEAARLLRASAWLGPVFALSAPTTAGDRKRCLEAGFDEVLSKPVTWEALWATVRPHLRTLASAERLRTDAAPASRKVGPAGERSEAEWSGLLALFAEQLPGRLALLEQGLRDRDRTRLRQTAHQLAGAAGQFGFSQLAAAARLLEQHSADQTLWTELSALLAAVRGAVPESLLRASPSAAFGPPAGTAGKRYRVLLADDDLLVRAALRLMVDRLPDFEVAAETANGRETLERLKQVQPDIALVDIEMPELNGLKVAARVAAVAPRTRVVILTAHLRREIILQAFQAGVAGFLTKDAGPGELEQALSAVARGETYYTDVVSQQLAAGGGHGG